MPRKLIYILTILSLFIIACKVEDIISELGNSKITAKENLGDVISKAKGDFAADAELASIYGWNVDTAGEIELQTPTENAFVYSVQSDAQQSNEFYVPVYQSSPIRSPINFDTMLSFIKDTTAKNIMGMVFGTLATVSIDASANYADSPDVLSKMFARSDVITFRTMNPETKFDMFLVPSKSIDSTNVTNAADWIVNFYGDTSSLVLWLHPGTVEGTIDVISN